jgi:hypothetical protein
MSSERGASHQRRDRKQCQAACEELTQTKGGGGETWIVAAVSRRPQHAPAASLNCCTGRALVTTRHLPGDNRTGQLRGPSTCPSRSPPRICTPRPSAQFRSAKCPAICALRRSMTFRASPPRGSVHLCKGTVWEPKSRRVPCAWDGPLDATNAENATPLQFGCSSAVLQQRHRGTLHCVIERPPSARRAARNVGVAVNPSPPPHGVITRGA